MAIASKQDGSDVVSPTVKEYSSEDDYLGPFIDREPFCAGNAALVVIDMQYASASRDLGLGRRLTQIGRQDMASWRFDRIEDVVVPNIQRLLSEFREAGAPVLYLTVGSTQLDFSDLPDHLRAFAEWTNNRVGEREHEILEDLKPLPSEVVINKTTVSGFNSSEFDSTLRTLGIREFYAVGVSTNSCVETTLRDAADLGYRTAIVADACSAGDEELHLASLKNIGRQFALVLNTQDVVAQVRSGLMRTKD